MRRWAPLRRTFPIVTNHRGAPVGVWLGAAYFAILALWVGMWVLVGSLRAGAVSRTDRSAMWMLAGCAVVLLAGLYDDYHPARTRGLVRQLRALGAGRLTPGLVKMVAIVGAAAVVAWMLGARGLRLGLAIPVVAGSANLWNLLDVVPGRSLKFFLPATAALLATGPAAYAVVAGPALVLGCAALALDLPESAMLGDAGSNVLGFIVGIGLMEVLGTAGLVLALAAILGLHALSETVTLSRLIEAAPPLRWFDRLGRLAAGRGAGSRQ